MRSFYRKRKIIFILLIVVGVLSLSSFTYAIFTITTSQSGTNEINTMKCLELTFSNQKNNINLVNTYPMTDERGAKNTPYTFTLTNNCGTYVEYSVGLMSESTNTVDDQVIKTMFSLKEDVGDAVLLTEREKGKHYNNNKTYILRNDGLANGESKNYKLRLWLDYDATRNAANKHFSGKIIIDAQPKSSSDNIKITADLNGGTLNQDFNEVYHNGDIIKLNDSTKEGYVFDGWEIISGDGKLIKNLTNNGSFEDGISEWTVANSLQGISSTDDKSQGRYSLLSTSIKSVNWNDGISRIIDTKLNHKYYYTANVKYNAASTSTATRIVLSNPDGWNFLAYVNNNTQNEWVKLSLLYNNTEYTEIKTRVALIEGTNGTTVGDYYYTDEIMFIDLTEAFGSGNEPTKEWCDSNLKWFNTNSIIIGNENIKIKANWKKTNETNLMVRYDGLNNTKTGHSNTTTTWEDLSGNDINATISGASCGSDYLLFDGIDDYAGISKLNYANYTIELILEKNSFSNKEEVIISNFDAGGYGLITTSASYFANQAYITSKYYRPTYSTAINLNTKYYLAGSYDGNMLNLYVNGGLVQYTTQAGEIVTPINDTIMMIGANPTGSRSEADYFAGKIYSVRIYNRALSAYEISQNYSIDKDRYGL